MTKIILIQLPTSQYTAEKVYPLGLARLASLVPKTMTKLGLDMNLSADPWPELAALLSREQPEIIALSFRNLDPLAQIHNSYLASLLSAAKMARALVPQARILCGGPAFSLFSARLMELAPQIDFGMVGEGEGGFAMLLAPQVDPAQVPGLIYREGNTLKQNKVFRADLNQLPPLDTQLFPLALYQRGNAYVAAMGLESKRGCALTCGYCTYPRLGGGQTRCREPQLVVDDMAENLARGCSLIHFTDSVVNRPAQHLEAICQEILRRGLKVQWTGFFREDSLSQELADLCVQAGLVTFYFSADALTGQGLRLLNKGLRKDDIFRAAEITARTGALACYHFMVNLPGDGTAQHQEAKESLARLFAIHDAAANLGAVILSTVRLYPEAPLTKRLLQSGELSPDIDLLFPTYYNPPASAHVLHELNAYCHQAGIAQRLGLELP
jgi:putative variant cofactor biosynthesis B12-binding/radical SAM domain protein 1